MQYVIKVANPDLGIDAQVPLDNVLQWDRMFPPFVDELEGFTLAEEFWPLMSEIDRQIATIAIYAYRLGGMGVDAEGAA